jgi:hypothetical protein
MDAAFWKTLFNQPGSLGAHQPTAHLHDVRFRRVQSLLVPGWPK